MCFQIVMARVLRSQIEQSATRRVKVRMTVEFDKDFPADWSDDLIGFSLNESSWCASNVIEEIDAIEPCLCAATKFELI